LTPAGASAYSRLVRRLFLAILIWSAATPTAAWAQNTPSTPKVSAPTVVEGRDWQLGIDFSGWLSSGYTTWAFSGADINYLSELRWRGTDSFIGQVSADFIWKRLVFNAAYGQSTVNGGVLIDDDFILDDHNGRFSHTRSAVEGNGVWYVTGDVGGRLVKYRVSDNPLEGYLDLLIGYQYWSEQYEAFGATGFSYFGGVGFPAVANHSIKVITHTYSWQSIRLGFRQFTPVWKGLGVKNTAMFLPYTWAQMTDVHWLRTDLMHNPSFASRAQGGFGFQGDVAVTYSFLKYFMLEVGYRYWMVDPGGGKKFTYPAVGGRLTDNLQDMKTTRSGPFLGLQARW
jgi:hypothetical protein